MFGVLEVFHHSKVLRLVGCSFSYLALLGNNVKMLFVQFRHLVHRCLLIYRLVYIYIEKVTLAFC